jgi:pyridoxine 5-phosphate synthase
MKKIRLGVNIDHIATIRNARGEYYPEPLRAAFIVQKSGADSLTIHLREDRRHINDEDLKKIKKNISIPLNLEMAPTREMLKIALRYKPNYVCLVPEKRREVTTEGGLNLKKKYQILKKIVKKLNLKKIRVSFFIEPNIKDVILAKKLGASCVELHTGKYCKLFLKRKPTKNAISDLLNASSYARKIKLEVHAGHGLTYKSIKPILKIKTISELNIGHFIVSESLFIGLKKTIKNFRKIISN